jgi:hypothetical protein
MDDEFIFFECVHCDGEIAIKISELNCRIFRHGIYKKTYEQINPHMKKKECDRLFNQKLIYGCGKPFRIVEEIQINEKKETIKKYKIENSDYI